jgi:uncharacterized repeat protein (TIGR04138 family)
MMLVIVLEKLKTALLKTQRTVDEVALYFAFLPPEERASLVFLKTCLEAAHQKSTNHYADPKAADILAVAGEVAETLYDEAAREELRKMGIVSSAALGKLVYRFIERDILSESEGDSIEDFNVRSALDDFLENGG